MRHRIVGSNPVDFCDDKLFQKQNDFCGIASFASNCSKVSNDENTCAAQLIAFAGNVTAIQLNLKVRNGFLAVIDHRLCVRDASIEFSLCCSCNS